MQCGTTSFLFKSNTMQSCLSNSTIPRAVQLKTIVLYCRRNSRFLVHTSPPRKFSECAARFLIRPARTHARARAHTHKHTHTHIHTHTHTHPHTLSLFDHFLTSLISSSLARRNSLYPYAQLTRWA